jgi:hypothetical protein
VRGPSVQFDDQIELVVADVVIEPPASSVDGVLPAAGRQSVRALDIAEVAQFER